MADTLLDVAIDRGDLPIPPLAASEHWQSLTLALEIPSTVSLSGTLQRETPSGNASWVTLDWGNLRQIIGVSVTLASASAGLYVGMKVSAGGVWFVPVPPGKLDPTSRLPVCQGALSFQGLTGSWSFPPVVASALYLELINSTGAAQAANVTGVQVTALNEAVDLSLSFGNSNRKWLGKKTGKLEEIDLLALAQPEANRVQLRAAGGVQVRSTLTTRKLTASNPAAGIPSKATFPWPSPGASTSAVRWEIPAPSTLVAVRADLQRELTEETLKLSPSTAPSLRQAQLLDPRHAVAQSLAPCPEGLAAVDVWLGALPAAASGTLRLCADANGRPGEALLSAAWTLEKGESGWRSLPVAQLLPSAWWLVVESQDEALVALDSSLPLSPARRRTGHGPWLEGAAPLCLRLRCPAPPPPSLTAVVSRGAKKLVLQVQDRLDVNADGLNQLNQASGPVTVELRSPVAGTIALQNLQVLLGS